MLQQYKPVFGLIFLFKWVHDENPQGSLVKDSRVLEMFFAKQVCKIFALQFPKPCVEITEIHSHLTLFWQKFREINGFTKEITN